MNELEIVLIRHGQTDWNFAGRIQGHLDISLNAVGVAQAASLRRCPAITPLSAVYSSDLERAYRTAAQLVSKQQLILREARLRERHLGVLQGLTREEAMSQQPQAWNAFSARALHAPLEGGESLMAFYQRVGGLLCDVASRHAGERIALVTHGGVLDMAYRFVKQLPLDTPRQVPIGNASVSVLVCNRGQWGVKSWGEVAHLDGSESERRSTEIASGGLA
jgi:probable phosphoglycerate mutase